MIILKPHSWGVLEFIKGGSSFLTEIMPRAGAWQELLFWWYKRKLTKEERWTLKMLIRQSSRANPSEGRRRP